MPSFVMVKIHTHQWFALGVEDIEQSRQNDNDNQRFHAPQNGGDCNLGDSHRYD